MKTSSKKRLPREVVFGNVKIGGGNRVAIQSMTATKTTDVAATVAMVRVLAAAGADVVRVAVDTPRDADALREIRTETTGITLSVDLQENWRLAERAAPWVDKIRYNPGHLHHVAASTPWQDKVASLVAMAREHNVALRVGVNCGSLDPVLADSPDAVTSDVALASAVAHSRFLDSIGFTNYCVSLKDSDPRRVVAANRAFAKQCPEVPLHLGVTEAGMPPEGVFKSRLAMETLLADGIGETLRVSLTVPNSRKHEEIDAGRLIVANAARGIVLTEAEWSPNRLNIISCPSCARVENEAFVELAERVREATLFAKDRPLTIAVMGCRVNGPGETDHADFGIWCGANSVCLKRKTETIGEFSHDEAIERLVCAIRKLSDRCDVCSRPISTRIIPAKAGMTK
ncbi:MAG: (E)-4-hydroxy-3-methylbut-2-enyl-diphosphate synthase [Thermoguttaceae bacterium]